MCHWVRKSCQNFETYTFRNVSISKTKLCPRLKSSMSNNFWSVSPDNTCCCSYFVLFNPAPIPVWSWKWESKHFLGPITNKQRNCCSRSKLTVVLERDRDWNTAYIQVIRSKPLSIIIWWLKSTVGTSHGDLDPKSIASMQLPVCRPHNINSIRVYKDWSVQLFRESITLISTLDLNIGCRACTACWVTISR